MSFHAETVVKTLAAAAEKLVVRLQAAEQRATFCDDGWTHERGGGGRTRVLADGAVFERAGVGYSHIYGPSLPAAASASRPHLAGKPFGVAGVSAIVHPRNPYCPTSHVNVRMFWVGEGDEMTWWSGGGFDLTPSYGFDEDCKAWHQHAKAVCDGLDTALYAAFKQRCDDYFFLPHRGEPRGIGGVFFDDFAAHSSADTLAFLTQVLTAYADAYLDIIARRKDSDYGQRERDWQCQRRGRYVEFNLLYDRGTVFGLKSGGRPESILMSMPPAVSWQYDYQPEPGSPEAQLLDHYLKPKDWI